MAWKSAPPAAAPHLPVHFGSWQVHDRLRQLGLGDLARVVDEHGGARRDADPLCRSTGRTPSRPGPGSRRRPGASRPAFWTVVIAGEFSVRNTSAGDSAALLDDLGAHRGVVAVADLDLDAGLLLELLGPRLGEVLVLGAVDRQLVRVELLARLEAAAAGRQYERGGGAHGGDEHGASGGHGSSIVMAEPGGARGGVDTDARSRGVSVASTADVSRLGVPYLIRPPPIVPIGPVR